MTRVTVCELRNNWAESDETFNALMEHLQTEKPDFVLLPEMPFYKWLAATDRADPEQWRAAVTAHDQWFRKMRDIPVSIIAGTRPVINDGRRFNEGFIWEKTIGYKAAHTKYYLPNEKGFWEATWYERGARDFKILTINGMNIGFLICSELWFSVHAREYLMQNVHLLVCPRATPAESVDKWITGGRTAAVVAGAFCLSSNFNGPNVEGLDFGGSGWIIGPEGGDVLGLTSDDKPFLTMDIDLDEAEKAKKTYPRYIPD